MILRKVSRWTFFMELSFIFMKTWVIWLLTGPSTPSRKSGRTVKRGGHLVETRYGQVTCTNFYLGKLFSEITDVSLKPLNPSLDTVPPFPSNAQAFFKTLTHFPSTPNLHAYYIFDSRTPFGEKSTAYKFMRIHVNCHTFNPVSTKMKEKTF